MLRFVRTQGSTRLALFAALAVPSLFLHSSVAAAATHHHYKLIDVGTFGGPDSLVNTEPGHPIINSHGTLVGGADTSVLTPIAGCYNPVGNLDCYISHAFAWSGDSKRDLGTLRGGNFSYAEGINESGLIVGVSETDQFDPTTGIPEFHAVLWQNDQIQDLGTLGGTASFAGALNDSGQVIGVSLNNIPDPYTPLGLGSDLTLTQTRGFLWQNGTMRDLGTLGGPDTWVSFINDAGQIAGASFTSDALDPLTGTPSVGVFLWQHGKMKDIGNLGGDNGILGLYGIVNGLNNLGEVTGAMMLPDNQNTGAFLWDGRTISYLGTLGGSWSVATGINDAGEVTGFAALPGDQANHAFLWRNGVMTDLGTLHGDLCSDAIAVDSFGQVLGASQSNAGGCNLWTTAFLWESGGPSVDLNELVTNPIAGVHLYVGLWANGLGEIVAAGVPPDCPLASQDICGHTYVLMPCDDHHPNIEGCDYSLVETAKE